MIFCDKSKVIIIPSHAKTHHKGAFAGKEIIDIQANHIKQLQHVIMGLQGVIENQRKEIAELKMQSGQVKDYAE